MQNSCVFVILLLCAPSVGVLMGSPRQARSKRTRQKEGGDKRAFTQYGVSPGEAKAVSIYYKIKEEKR
jgi:hypothetical protein